jgi:hypothetical protein
MIKETIENDRRRLKREKTIHDFIAGTYVTYEKPNELQYEQ